MTLADAKEWIGLVSAADILTFAALLVAMLQLRDNNKTVKGQSWLMLRNVMAHYDHIHARFRYRGRWHASETEPHTVEEWAETELYMGLFEYCKQLMDDGLLDETQLRKWYKYRIESILQNPRVVTYKLHQNADGWQDFIALCKKLGIPIPEPAEKLPAFIY